jgi:NADH:flavin oxidoreductase / NADH oxidase family
VYSAVKTVHDALRIVEQAEHPAGAVLVDALHLRRSGGSPAELATAAPQRLPYAQLCDGPLEPVWPDEDHARTESRTGRLLPGDGQLPSPRPPGCSMDPTRPGTAPMVESSGRSVRRAADTPRYPLQVGLLELRNRVVSPPMERNYCTVDGRVTDRCVAYLRARAAGGAALLFTEATYVRADGRGRESSRLLRSTRSSSHSQTLHVGASAPESMSSRSTLRTAISYTSSCPVGPIDALTSTRTRCCS